MPRTEAQRQTQKRWNEKNREKLREYQRVHRLKNREKRNAASLECYRAKSPEKLEAAKAAMVAGNVRRASVRGVSGNGWMTVPRSLREKQRKLAKWSRAESFRAAKAEAQRERMAAHDAWLEALDEPEQYAD